MFPGDLEFELATQRAPQRVARLPYVFSPLALSPPLWLKADAGLYQERTGASATTPASADADPVGSWLDQSGNARHQTATTDAKRPVLKLSIQNGLPVVRFDGVDDLLATAAFSLGTFSIFVVVQTSDAECYLWTRGSGSGADYCYNPSGATIAAANRGGTGFSSRNSPGAWLNNAAFRVVEVSMDGTHAGHTMTIDGVLQSLTDAATGDPGAAADSRTFQLGADSNGGSPMAGDIGEVLVFPQLAAGNLALVRAYLKARWGTA